MGCVDFSYTLLETLLNLNINGVSIVGVVTKSASSFNSDFRNLSPIAEKHEIPVYFWDKFKQADFNLWLKEMKPDLLYCFGWSNLLNEEILQIPLRGTVGYHPAKLPQNRGRHPIIWSLVLGLTRTASTFFMMSQDADSGPIISQVDVDISESDDARLLYESLKKVACIQVVEITKAFLYGSIEMRQQNSHSANYWRKRTKEDGKIDWRMSAENIRNLVRALSRPYVGAHCQYGTSEVKIWKVQSVDCDLINIEPGKVLKIDTTGILVKCGVGALNIIEHEFPSGLAVGDYL